MAEIEHCRPVLSAIWECESLAAAARAVLATAAAVATVFIVDSIRNWRKAAKTLPARIGFSGDLARSRADSIHNRDAAAPGEVQLSIGPNFDVAAINALIVDAFERLSAKQRKSLSRILFAMTEADRLNDRAAELYLDHVTRRSTNNPDAESLMQAEMVLLDEVAKQCDAFSAGPRGKIPP